VEWTLTRSALLSFRPAAARLDEQTRLRIRTLGCARSRRGSRGGRPKTKTILTYSSIPVVIGRRSTDLQPRKPAVERRRCLSTVPRHASHAVHPVCHADVASSAIPSLYLLNAAAITKPLAIQHLTADLSGFDIDIAIITETHLKQKHDR